MIDSNAPKKGLVSWCGKSGPDASICTNIPKNAQYIVNVIPADNTCIAGDHGISTAVPINFVIVKASRPETSADGIANRTRIVSV
jgi:hypothetical protein